MKSKFIFFDVGGVIVQDFSGTDKWERFKRELNISPHDSARFDTYWNTVELEICVGRETDNLKEEIKDKFGATIPDEYSLLVDGFINRFEKNESIWPLLNRAKEKYSVGLLTNMYPRMLNLLEEKGLLPKIQWDVIVESVLVGHQKPDYYIYEIAEKESGFHGNEILFVENTMRHINAAKSFGWHTFHYDPGSLEDSNKKLSSLI